MAVTERPVLRHDQLGWRRQWLDRGSTALVRLCAGGVLLTVVLMLGFLIWSALPLMAPASVHYLGSVPAAAQTESGPDDKPLAADTTPPAAAAQRLLALLYAAQLLQPDALKAHALLPGARAVLVLTHAGDLRLFSELSTGVSDTAPRMRELHRFDTGSARAEMLLMDHPRRLLLALDPAGRLQVFHATTGKRLLDVALLQEGRWQTASLDERASELRLLVAGRWQRWQLRAPHPDISWRALWQAMPYEGYAEDALIWQSAAAYEGGESKYSLSPLLFGTFKAAVYCMLFAAPLGVAAAIYTAYFMSRPLRRVVKPGVELMEAFPTVVLGFIAGLWLAPQLERLLPAVLLLPLLLPLGVLLFAVLWQQLPAGLRARCPDGVRPLLLLPWLALLVQLNLAAAPALEQAVFGGDVQAWLQQRFGLDYVQRNTLVVGLAMGFAVIPTVFSIAEDAVFSVPRSLSDGSLALGATPWQTLVGVVLPMASPGIFSALMIGLGRALGETMIVLMATGNTALIEADPFSGLRSLAANIAMEAPEAIVGSTHFRVLFLSALVLFGFSFAANTVAEWVRLRLRHRYAAY